jgi:hypothetical protein
LQAILAQHSPDHRVASSIATEIFQEVWLEGGA